MASPVRFDHVLIELSTRDFEAPPSWLTDNFTILEGGTHAGGLTRNNLIPLPDTTYIELLNIITPPPSHEAWTPKKYPGDFALTTLPPVTATENYKRLVSALGSSNGGDGNLGINITYKPPIPGGRKTHSGEDVKWEIVKAEILSGTEPEGTGSRGAQYGPTTVPFFCHDVTDRKVRVPRVPGSGHPSGVVGLKAIEVVVPRKQIGAFAELYTAVLGVEGRRTEHGDREFALRAPAQGAEEETGVVRLRASSTEEDERYLTERGVGVSALVFRVQGDGDGELRLPIAGYYLNGR